MADLELNGIERMYADDLFDAVERAVSMRRETTWITERGERRALIVPLDWLPDDVRELLKELASIFTVEESQQNVEDAERGGSDSNAVELADARLSAARLLAKYDPWKEG